MIVAIDGPAAAGKGTLARRLADHLGFAMLDTGLLYRAVGKRVLDAEGDPADPETAVAAARGLGLADLDDPALRSEDAAAAASKVAAIPAVREVLIALQRDFAHRPPGGGKGAVLDGRDIGTRICPDAEAKIFITASPEERARRRLKELRERRVEAIHERVLQDMKERDARDSERDVSPLAPADDAHVIDTDAMSADEVFAEALQFVLSRNSSG